jgi:hypothetical protein
MLNVITNARETPFRYLDTVREENEFLGHKLWRQMWLTIADCKAAISIASLRSKELGLEILVEHALR